MSSSPSILLGELQIDRRVAFPVLVACGAFIILCFRFAVDWYWCLPGVIVFLLMAGCVGKQISIDMAGWVVREHYRLLGRRLLSVHDYRFSDFDAIVYQRYDESGDTGRRMMKVGLRHRSGKKLWIRGFLIGSSSRKAEEFAWQLSCDTGIEIHD